MFGVFGNSNNKSRNEAVQKSQKDMSPRERRDFERKQREAESDREWDKLMDADTLGFLD